MFRIFTTAASISEGERMETFVPGKSGLDLDGSYFCLFCYCLYTHTIVGNADGSMHTGQSTYGDMNMHFSFITSIANQQTFPPEYSLLPGHKLSYPFLCDSVSSSLYLMGASLRLAYVLPMLGAILQVFMGFYCLIKYWLGRSATALIAWILFFWNGGLGFVYFDNAEKIHKIFAEFYMTPTNYLDKNLRWVQVMVDMLIPQRATLFGWAILFPLLAFLFRAIAERKKEIVCYGGHGGWCASNDPYTFVFGVGDDLCGMVAIGSDR